MEHRVTSSNNRNCGLFLFEFQTVYIVTGTLETLIHISIQYNTIMWYSLGKKTTFQS